MKHPQDMKRHPVDNCIPVFGNKEKTIEKWANLETGGEEIKTHNEGPSNKFFTSTRIVASSSKLYREKYDTIEWNRGVKLI